MLKFYKVVGSRNLDKNKRDFKYELIGRDEFEFQKPQLCIFEMQILEAVQHHEAL